MLTINKTLQVQITDEDADVFMNICELARVRIVQAEGENGRMDRPHFKLVGMPSVASSLGLDQDELRKIKNFLEKVWR